MILHNGKTMLTGKRSPGTIDKLWMINPYLSPLEQQEKETVNEYVSVALNRDNISHRIVFYYASLFSPLLSTWCDDIYAGQFTTWPDPASAQVRCRPPQSIIMYIGNLDQERYNVRSTQPRPPTPTEIKPTPEDILAWQHDAAPPVLEPPGHKSHCIYDYQEYTCQLYTDPTSRFLQPSISGKMTVLVAYEYDTNYVHNDTMQNKSGPQILAAYKRVRKMLSAKIAES
jgi:hypothetical protein